MLPLKVITCFSSAVTGPQFHKVHVGVGHRLDAFSSGVLGDQNSLTLKFSSDLLWNALCAQFSHISTSVLGVGKGNGVLEHLCKSHVTRVKLIFVYYVIIHLTFNCYSIFFIMPIFFPLIDYEFILSDEQIRTLSRCLVDTFMQTFVFVLYFKDYTLEGEFGKATDNFTDTGRVIEKNHI